MYSWLNPPPRRPSMKCTKYAKGYYYSSAQFDALDRRAERVSERCATQPSVHSLTAS